MPKDLPDDPELLKQMLAKMQSRMGVLEEQVALLRQRLFGRKSEQMIDPKAPQMALFNDAEHELICACGCRKHSIGEEISEQLEIVPMQIRVIKHVRKIYGCRECEAAPVLRTSLLN